MNIQEEMQKLFPQLVEWRRDFHQHPESGWVEYRTSAKIAEELTHLGFEVYAGPDVCKPESRMGVPHPNVLQFHERRAVEEGADPAWIRRMSGGQTGVVGILRTRRPGPVIALRFDIDALDMNESTEESHRPVRDRFASVHPGMMHACGHDGHAAIGLGAARMIMKLYELRRLNGEIRLLFQPAEEGARGSKSMVEAGWLDGVDYFFSGHIGSGSRTLGEIVAAVGGFLATTKINVTFHGRAAHAGSHPHEGRNALLAAAAAAVHLHGISRHGQGASRIHVGTLHAGTSRNVVAERAEMKLEVRGETTEINGYMKEEAIRVIDGCAAMYGTTAEIDVVGEAPSAKSSESLIPLIEQAASQTNRVNTVVPYRQSGASEDVVHMIRHVQQQGGQAAYMYFGTPLAAGHHQAAFDFDEQVLAVAVELYTRIVLVCQN